jgi:hypothetical protein
LDDIAARFDPAQQHPLVIVRWKKVAPLRRQHLQVGRLDARVERPSQVESLQNRRLDALLQLLVLREQLLQRSRDVADERLVGVMQQPGQGVLWRDQEANVVAMLAHGVESPRVTGEAAHVG